MRPGELTVIGTMFLAGLSVPGKYGHAENPKRPNVVLIIADDMAWDDCGVFGNPRGQTLIWFLPKPGINQETCLLTNPEVPCCQSFFFSPS